MKQDLISMLEAFRMGHTDRAARLFRSYAEKKVHALISEDHQRYMTSEQMEKHIEMLHVLHVWHLHEKRHVPFELV